ncbi:MAG: hypothetical protein JSR77_10210 [Planctomycetes bacterium]|nr:hypothetical protein [Planctomycetota bacterium]
MMSAIQLAAACAMMLTGVQDRSAVLNRCVRAQLVSWSNLEDLRSIPEHIEREPLWRQMCAYGWAYHHEAIRGMSLDRLAVLGNRTGGDVNIANDLRAVRGPGLEDPRPREALRIACVWTSENRVVYSQSPGSLVTVGWERASLSTFLPAALSTVNPLSLP